MSLSGESLQLSTKNIVQGLEKRQPLQASMRSGLVNLSGLLYEDAPEWDGLDQTEKGLYIIDAIDILTDGWNIVVDHLDYRGRAYKEGRSAEDAARIHFRLSHSQALDQYYTGEFNQNTLTDSAYLLGEHVLKITTPII